jgi:hypothetical protein
MRSSFVRVGSLTLLILLAACGEDEAGAAKLKRLDAGISRDSMLTLLGTGVLTASGSDTVRVDHGFRKSRYFIDGKFYEVYYVRDEPGDVEEPVRQKVETPIVIGPEGTVLGWGWKFYVEEGMNTLRLPTPLKEELPLSNALQPDSAKAK